MNRTAPTPHRPRAPLARIGWLACIAVPLALLLTLGARQITPALGESETSPASAESGFQPGEEGEWEAECVEGLEELEAIPGEAEELCEESDESETGSEACPLRSAHGHAVTVHDRLKITIGYTTNAPAAVKVQIHYGSAGAKTFTRQLGRSGVLRFTEKASKRHGKKVVVQIDPTGKAGCPPRRLALFLPS
ncbi:MAG: hypothetical protein ACRDLL_02180 [Solirubrobacterales bacterium]